MCCMLIWPIDTQSSLWAMHISHPADPYRVNLIVKRVRCMSTIIESDTMEKLAENEQYTQFRQYAFPSGIWVWIRIWINIQQQKLILEYKSWCDNAESWSFVNHIDKHLQIHGQEVLLANTSTSCMVHGKNYYSFVFWGN